MLKLSLSGLLLICSLYLTLVSSPPYELMNVLWRELMVITLGGLIIGYFTAAWGKGLIRKTFTKSLQFSFGISSAIFLLGYLYNALQGLV